MTNPTPLTENELKALAYFAVGVTSEGSIGGRDVSYRLSFAGNVLRDGRMDPVGNSGYSFGTLQIDLGQHPDVARDLLQHYQQWAVHQPDRAALHLDPREYANTLTALQRTGRQMDEVQARDIDRNGINRFFASDEGRTFVHGLDADHVTGVTRVDGVTGNRDSALERLQRTVFYRNASDADQAEVGGMLMKLQNQSGTRFTPGILTRIERGELDSSADVKTAINGLMRNAANGNPDYIESGADNTLRGVGVFSALRGTSRDNPLHAAWASVIADPLMGPFDAHVSTAADPNRGVHYDTVRSLFLTPEASQRMIRALENGTTLAEGNPTPGANNRRSAGFFVSGDDFVHWNANGQGVACVDGRWRSVDPDNLRRVTNGDGTIDLRLTENGQSRTLLHVDPRARRAQADLEEGVDPGLHADQGDSAAQRRMLANDPSHPNFSTFNRIHDWVRGTGQWDEEHSHNVASALYREQAGNPLVQRVDMVTGGLGQDGAQNVFAVYAPHGDRGPVFRAQVDGRHASLQPAIQSLERAEQFTPQQSQEQLQNDRDLTLGPRVKV